MSEDKNLTRVFHIGVMVVMSDEAYETLACFCPKHHGEVVKMRRDKFEVHNIDLGSCHMRIWHKDVDITPMLVGACIALVDEAINGGQDIYTTDESL